MLTQRHVFLLHLNPQEEKYASSAEYNDELLTKFLHRCSQMCDCSQYRRGKVSPERLTDDIQVNSLPANRYKIDVSNLMPEFTCDIKSKNKTGEYWTLRSILNSREKGKQILTASNVDIVGRRSKSFLHTLATTKPPARVSEVLGTFPMDLLARHQWRFYQVFVVGIFVLHTIIMAVYTFDSQNSFRDSDINPILGSTSNETCSYLKKFIQIDSPSM